MVLLSPEKIVTAVLRNQAHSLGLSAPVRKLLDRRQRGGVQWATRPVESNVEHVAEVFRTLRDHLGDVDGKVGLEIGPGDNLGVGYCFLKAGCSKIYAVEQFNSVRLDQGFAAVLRQLDERYDLARDPGRWSRTTAGDVLPVREGEYALNSARLELKEERFEEMLLRDPVDFIYSNDVMEHVESPASVFAAAHRLLKPGGLFVNNIDLAGHNVFSNKDRPLDFLSCPDSLWDLMFSHIVTTNRVRYSGLLAAAEGVGFQVKRVVRLVAADPDYLRAVRPHLLPRYRDLPDEDLSVLQCILVAQK